MVDSGITTKLRRLVMDVPPRVLGRPFVAYAQLRPAELNRGLMEWSVLIMEAMPEVSMALPMLVFMLHSCSLRDETGASRRLKGKGCGSVFGSLEGTKTGGLLKSAT